MVTQPACSEIIDTLWKSALVGVAGYFIYHWAIKTGVTSGAWGSRGTKYLAGRASQWFA